MIYYKKKSLIKKILNNIKRKTDNIKSPSFKLSKGLFSFLSLFLFLFLALFYIGYLFLIPKYATEESFEAFINNNLLKNSKLTLDVSNLQINPNYKFDVNIKSEKLKLKYPNKKDFLTIENLNADINLLSLLRGYVDLNKIKTNKITIQTNFTKNNKYECFKYINSNPVQNSNFKIRNINLESDDFLLNIFDENLKKNFDLKSTKLKITSSEFKKPILITTTGILSSANHKISDFNLKLSIKTNPKKISELREKLINFDYNPLKYADIYKFYSNSNIDLKINPNDKKNNINGTISLKNYTFKVNNLQLPKNNLTFIFKDNKIHTNCDFKFFKNQNIQIDSNIILAKNKSIEAKLNSNEINLKDLKETFATFEKILNLKFNLDEFDLIGTANANIYLKSNFKTINSKGKLNILNAKILHKKTGLILHKINSNINFDNNLINILNTNAFINDAKFNLTGTIDDKTNLNLNIISDEINIAQLMSLIKDLPFQDKLLPKLNNYNFKSGLLKINSIVTGNISNPVVKSNSNFTNLKIELKQNNALIKIPKLNFQFSKSDILIPKTKIIYNDIEAYIDGKIKNYSSDQAQTTLNLTSKLPKNEKYFLIQNKPAELYCTLDIKNEELYITSCDISNSILITGKIINLSNNPILNDIKIISNEKTLITIPFYETSFLLKGNTILNGDSTKPNILGKLNLYNIKFSDLNLKIDDILLDIKDSKALLNIPKGEIFDTDFRLIAEIKYLKDKIIVNFANIYSNYINLENFEKYLKNSKTINKINYEINNMKGFIATIESQDFHLSSFDFEGNIKDNILNIKNFNADFLNGKINGEILVNLLNQKTKTKLTTKELNIRLLSNKIKELSIATSGKLSSFIEAQFQGFNFEEILNSIDGKINFNIENGELSQFAKLERFLQAGNILSQNILKLNLNSTLSAITKQNTGDFKTIEGEVEIKNQNAIIQYINTQGSNMSLHIEGTMNLINQYINAKILGRIPNSIIKNIGNLTDDKEISSGVTQEELSKIPPLAYQVDDSPTREFRVLIDGLIKNINSIRDFKWNN